MVTIRDIARRAGVSIGTVDRIIHNRGRFSPETARRVQRIVAELDYRPNQIARHLSRSALFRVAVLLPHPEQDSRYWALPLAGVRRAERELRDFGVLVEVHHFDRYQEGGFDGVARTILDREFDALAMTPLVEASARELLDRVDRQKPVVFFDTDAPGTRRSGFVGQNSVQGGRLAARLLSMLTGGAGRIVVVAPNVNNHHLDSRIAGLVESLPPPRPRAAQILRVSVESDRQIETLHRTLDRALGPGVRGVFVADASVHYVAEYLARRTARRPSGASRPALVGYDLVPENRRWLDEGFIDFLLTQRPAEQGYAAVNRLFRAGVLAEPIPDTEYTPIDIVTRENLGYFPSEEES